VEQGLRLVSGSPVDVSIVVPTFQRRDSVLRLLASLSGQTLPADHFEVIVSVDGSTDGTADAVRAHETGFRKLVLEQENRGRAAACNRAIHASAGEVVIILDDDMEPRPRMVEAHLEHHRREGRVGVLGAVPISRDRAAGTVARFVADKFNAHLSKLGSATAIGVRDFYTGNFSARRQLLLSVGGFDESFRIYGNEDVELAVRLLESGVRLVYSPDAAAAQSYDKSFRELAADTVAKGRTAVICAEKHPAVVQQLRIGTFERGSRRWRAVRSLALRLDSRTGILRRAIVGLGEWLGRAPDAVAWPYYRRALELLFWAGVGEERRRAAAGPGAAGWPA
jgi:GT2 family glycosyltransferase